MDAINETASMLSVEPTPSGQLMPEWLFNDLISKFDDDKLIIYPSEATRKTSLDRLSEYISSIDTSKHLTLKRLFSSLFLDLRLPIVMDNDALLFSLVHQLTVQYANDGRFPLMFTPIEGRKWSEYKTERLSQLHKELSELKTPWTWDNDPGVNEFRSLLLNLEKKTKKTHPQLMKSHLLNRLKSSTEVPFTLKGLNGIVMLDHCPEFSEMDRALLDLISKITPIHQLCSPGSFRLGFHGAYIADVEWCTEGTLPEWLPPHKISNTTEEFEWKSATAIQQSTSWHRISLERKEHYISSTIELVSDYLETNQGKIIIVDGAAEAKVNFWATRLQELGLICNLQSNNLREQSSIAGLVNALNIGEGLESWSFSKLRRLIGNTSFPLEFSQLSNLVHPTNPDWKPKPHLDILQNISLNFHVLGGPGALERWSYTLSIAKPNLGSDIAVMSQKFEETQWWLANILRIWAPLCRESAELAGKECIGCSSSVNLPLIEPIKTGTEWLNMIFQSLDFTKLVPHESRYSRAIPALQIVYEEHHRIMAQLHQLKFNQPTKHSDFISHILRIINQTELPKSRSESKNITILTPDEAFGLEADLIILAGVDADSWSMKAPKIPWLDTESRLKLGILNQDIEIRRARHQLKHLLNASKTVVVLDTSLDEGSGPCAPLAEFLQHQKNINQFQVLNEIPSFINPQNYDLDNLDRPWDISVTDNKSKQNCLTPRPFSMIMSSSGAIGSRSGNRGRDQIQRAGLKLSNNQAISIAPISLSNLAKSNEFEIFNDRLKRQPSHKTLERGEYLSWESREHLVSVDNLILRPSRSQAEMVTVDAEIWPHLGKRGAKSTSPAIDPRPLPPFDSGSEVFQSITGITSQQLKQKFWSASRIQSWLRCPRGAWLEKHLLANQPEDSSEDVDGRTRGLLVHEIIAHILQQHGVTEGTEIVSSPKPLCEGELDSLEKLWLSALEFIEQNAPWLSRKNAVAHHRCRDMLGIDSELWQQHLASEINLQPIGRIGRMLESELALENSAPIACEWNLNDGNNVCVITTEGDKETAFSFNLSGRIDRVDVVFVPDEIKQQAAADGVYSDNQRWIIIRDLKNIDGPKKDKQGSRHRTAIFDEVQLALYAKAWENAHPDDVVIGVGISEVGEQTHHYVEVDSTAMKYLRLAKIGIITNYTANHFTSSQDNSESEVSGFRSWIEERIQTSARAIISAEEGNFHPTPCQQCYYCRSSGMSPSAMLGGGHQ